MPGSATKLPQDPGTPPHPTARRPAGPLGLLLQLALTLAVLFGLTCMVVETVYWWSGPSLRGARAMGERLAPGIDDRDVLERIDTLWADDLYTYDQLKEAAAVLRREAWARIKLEWLMDAVLLLFWTACVLLGREAWRFYRICRPAPTIQSPVGILDDRGAFVPHALPFPPLDRHPLATLRPPPEWLRTTQPWTPLAGALLECYAAHPEWPAAPSADPSVSGTTLQGHVGVARLLDHALAVRARAMALADQRGLPFHLAELVGLGHDLGKLVTFRPEGPCYVRILSHHDRMSAVLFAALPEWGALPPDEQEDLATAVAFHHRRDRLPTRATPRARALLDLLAHADETIRFQERHPRTDPGVPPRAERALEPPAASPTDLQPRLLQVLRGLLPALRINTSPFDGRADVSEGFVMLLGSALLAALTAQLSPGRAQGPRTPRRRRHRRSPQSHRPPAPPIERGHRQGAPTARLAHRVVGGAVRDPVAGQSRAPNLARLLAAPHGRLAPGPGQPVASPDLADRGPWSGRQLARGRPGVRPERIPCAQ